MKLKWQLSLEFQLSLTYQRTTRCKTPADCISMSGNEISTDPADRLPTTVHSWKSSGRMSMLLHFGQMRGYVRRRLALRALHTHYEVSRT